MSINAAKYSIIIIMDNMDKRMKSASDIMKGFLEIIEESKVLHQFISKQKVHKNRC